LKDGSERLAAAAGVLLFAIHRRLAGGRNVPGFLALLAYSGFALLGVLPPDRELGAGDPGYRDRRFESRSLSDLSPDELPMRRVLSRSPDSLRQ
jgi:hypothetical protein